MNLLNQVIVLSFFANVFADICSTSHCICHPLENPENVSCAGDFIQVIPQDLPPYIQSLSLQNTRIRQSDSTLNHYDQLLNLDLSYNRITSISQSAFSYLSKLQSLNLESNHIEVLAPGHFKGLASLSVLNLRQNYLSQLQNSLFNELGPSLTSLDVSQNKLISLDVNIFEKCHQLSELDLSYNYLTSLDFLNLPSLTLLKLDGNTFGNLKTASPFKNCGRLEVISLNDCHLKELSDSFFDGIKELRRLFLDNNLFKKLPFSEKNLSQLVELRIGSYYLESIGTEFQRMAQLTRLSISGCNTKRGGGFTIDPDAFAYNWHLEELSIDSCPRLTSLPDGLLSHLTHLRSLNLMRSGINSLSPYSGHWSSLSSLDLTKVILTCDCSLSWVLGTNYTDFYRVLLDSNATCVGEKNGINPLHLLTNCIEESGSTINSIPEYYTLIALAFISGKILLIGYGIYIYNVNKSRVKHRRAMRLSKRIDKSDISVITQSVSDPSGYKDVVFGPDDEDESWTRGRAMSNFPDIKTSVI